MYITIDLETSGVTTHKRFCNPLDEKHFITAMAVKRQGHSSEVFYYEKEEHQRNFDDMLDRANINLLDYKVIVGQNVKFDLLWLWGSEAMREWLKANGMVWDTHTVQYLLDGQDKGARSLNDLAIKYGGRVKDDRVGELFKAGVLACDIEPSLLIPYAHEDVRNTDLVMKAQLKEAKQQGMMPIIKQYMSHYLAVIEMEYNGMYVDVDTLLKHKAIYEKELQEAIETIQTKLDNPEFNPMSPKQVSEYLFGDTRPVGEKVLKTVKKPIAKDILRVRKLTKLLKTYIHYATYYKRDNKNRDIKKGDIRQESGLKCMIHKQGTVHSEFKTAVTATGRLSSRSPNMQNLPPDIIDIFKPRYKDWSILEIDFSQLEVRLQAFLAQSPQMIKDIKNDIDFHCLRLSYAENLPYKKVVQLCKDSEEWKLKRKKAKAVSFQKAYGAHVKKISEETGLLPEVVEEIFAKEDARYPEIAQENELVTDSIKANRVILPELASIFDKNTEQVITIDGEQKAIGKYQSLTGKKYTFTERVINTKRGVFRYFSSPDICNYPVQGLAADIVGMQVGRVFKYLLGKEDTTLLINEIHDSIILEVKDSELDLTCKEVCAILTDVKGSFKKYFKIDFNVPIKVDYSVGKTWKECK